MKVECLLNKRGILMPKLYIETSVLSGLFAFNEPEIQAVTNEFFKELATGVHIGYVSDLVASEVERSPEPRKSQLKSTIVNFHLTSLEVTEKALTLGLEYVKGGLIPRRYSTDATHIAIATVHYLDALVSWNLRHIVKLKTILGINKINKQLGYPLIIIVTPEEVLGW
jgi:hypothetical protein